MRRRGRGRGRDAWSSNRRAQRCVPAPGRGLAQVRRASRVSLKLFQLRGRRAQRLQLGAGGRVAFSPSCEWDSVSNRWRRIPRPPGVGAAGRMRSLSAAWLLGGVILLGTSASCNRTVLGEKLGQGGLVRLRSGGPGHHGQVGEEGQVREGCSAAATNSSRHPAASSRRL